MLIRVIGWLVLSLVVAVPAQGQTIPGSNGNAANCFPFGCAVNSRYQQVYLASAFAGITNISSISFFRHINPVFAGNLSSGTFTFSLSTTSASPTSLSSTFANNIGANNAFFGAYVLTGGAVPSFLDFVGNTFIYDPAAGNLLLDISIANLGHTGERAHLDATRDTPLAGRVYGNGTTGIADHQYGLATQFNRITVPEPVTALLVATGLLGLALFRRREDLMA